VSKQNHIDEDKRTNQKTSGHSHSGGLFQHEGHDQVHDDSNNKGVKEVSQWAFHFIIHWTNILWVGPGYYKPYYSI